MSNPKVNGKSQTGSDAGIRFLEEFVWFLRAQRQPIASDLDAIVRNAKSSQGMRLLSKRVGPEVDLIGVLPYLLVDTEIFANNEDIVSFCLEVFGVGVPRWQKKSRMELIGFVVTTVATSDKRPGKAVIHALELLTDDSSARAAVSKMRDLGGLSWTKLIDGLTGST
jgi:hypothetical protein